MIFIPRLCIAQFIEKLKIYPLNLILIFSVFVSMSFNASANTITNVRAWTSPEKTRLVFEVDKKISYNIFQLHKPERLIVDIPQTQVNHKLLTKLENSGIILKVRQSLTKKTASKTKLRLVFELAKPTSVQKFLLPPNAKYRYRLVVDLFSVPSKNSVVKNIAKSSAVKKEVNKASTISTKNKGLSQKHKSSYVKTIRSSLLETPELAPRVAPTLKPKKSVNQLIQRKLIVAIDAGHGGEDPGATGRLGKKEKHIVFAIAKKLNRLVNKQPGMKGVLIRQGDYYVSLRSRTKKAREAKADVFISIHADAFRNAKAKGSSVFILSKRGASSESAKWLATKENSADLAGGVSLDDKDDLLVKVLLDLSQTATIEGSVSVANRILKGFKKIGKVHKKQVERAGFVVLKSPDIPSVLVETGFISNPEEERKLSTSSYQQKLANAIFKGVNDFFKRYPIPGTIYGQKLGGSSSYANANTKSANTTNYSTKKFKTKHRYHMVKRGDSLSKLSLKYKISIKSLKQINRLKNNRLYVGKKLRVYL